MAAQWSTCEYDSYNAFVVEQAIDSIEDILQQNNSELVGLEQAIDSIEDILQQNNNDLVGLSTKSFIKPIDWTTKHCLLTNNGCTRDLVCDNKLIIHKIII